MGKNHGRMMWKKNSGVIKQGSKESFRRGVRIGHKEYFYLYETIHKTYTHEIRTQMGTSIVGISYTNEKQTR